MLQIIKDRYRQLRQQINDGHALGKLAGFQLGYVPWTGFAVRPGVMLTAVNEAIVNGRRDMVEFGAGISTIYLAKVASMQEGRLLSIEDDAGWAEVVRASLVREGLDSFVEQVVAPLKPCSFSRDGLAWYDEAIVAGALNGRSIDFVLVDGPKAFEPGKQLARFPAFPAVAKHLAPRSALILDDIGRAGEQQVLELWQREQGFDFKVTKSAAGCAICHRGSHFDPQ